MSGASGQPKFYRVLIYLTETVKNVDMDCNSGKFYLKSCLNDSEYMKKDVLVMEITFAMFADGREVGIKFAHCQVES